MTPSDVPSSNRAGGFLKPSREDDAGITSAREQPNSSAGVGRKGGPAPAFNA